LIKASYDIKENPDKSYFSLISAGALTLLLPILVGIFTAYRDQSTGKKILYGLFATFVLFIGIYSYYIYTLSNGCNNRIDNTICWTYAAHITFACFISLTAFFIWLSTKNVSKYFQLLPSSLLIDPKLPLSIFSVVIYLLCWISWVIVFFRHSKISDFFQDEKDDVVNRIFTLIGILTLILLFIKQNETGTELINIIVEFIRLPVSTILLHVSILTIFIISLYSSVTYITQQQKNNIHSTEVNNIIYVLFGILCLFFVSYLDVLFQFIRKKYGWKWVIIFYLILFGIIFDAYSY
jgi:cation transport ATPase